MTFDARTLRVTGDLGRVAARTVTAAVRALTGEPTLAVGMQQPAKRRRVKPGGWAGVQTDGPIMQ